MVETTIIKPKVKMSVAVKPVRHAALSRTPEVEELQYAGLEGMEEPM